MFQYRVPKGYDKNRREMYRGGCKKNPNNSLKLKFGKFFKFDFKEMFSQILRQAENLGRLSVIQQSVPFKISIFEYG